MSQISYGTITITDTNDIESIIIEYAKNSSNLIPPGSESIEWSTTRPTWEQGKYIWQRTRIHKTGTSAIEDTFGDAVCLSGSSGADGRSLISTETRYTNTIAGASQSYVIDTTTEENWLENIPEYNKNKPDYWVRIKNTFSSAPLIEYIYYKDNGTTDAIATAVEANSMAGEALDQSGQALTNSQNAISSVNNLHQDLISYKTSNDLSVQALESRTKHMWDNPTNRTNGSTYDGQIWTYPDYPVGSYMASGIENVDFKEENSDTYGFNTFLQHNSLNLRYNAIKYTELSTANLIFYYPKVNDATYVQGESALKINADGINLFSKGSGTEDTRLAATLTTSGLTIKKGSIILGTTGGTDAGNVTLSNQDFIRLINGTSRGSLRMAIGSRFGVKNDGTVYASNAVISGQITVSDDSNVYTKEQSYNKDQVATLAGWSVRINVTAISYVSNTATLKAILYYKGNEATSTDLSGATYTYQWYKDTTAISGATSATLSVTNTSALGLNGIYTCKVNVTKHNVSNAASNSVDLMSLQAAGEPNKYITKIDDSGIKVHAQNNATTNYLQITAEGTSIYKNGVRVANYGQNVVIGAATGSHVLIQGTGQYRGIELYRKLDTDEDPVSIGWFGTNSETGLTTIRVGIVGSTRFAIGLLNENNHETLQGYNKNGVKYFEVSEDSLRYGSNLSQTVAKQSDVTNLQNWQDNFAIGGRNLLTKTGTPATLTTAADRNWFSVPSYRVTDYGGVELANTNNVNITYSFDYSITGVDAAFNLTASLATAQGTYGGGVVVAKIPTGSSSGHAQGSRDIPSAMRTYAVGQGILFGGSGNSNANAVLTVSNVKVEIGNQATSWTPAPEDIASDVDGASKTASSYITDIDSKNGITIKAVNGTTDSNSTTGNFIKLNANGLYIYQGGIEKAYFTGTAAAIGTTGKGRIIINDNGLYVYNYISSTQKLVASFGATAQVGRNDSSRFLMNADSLQAYNSSNKLYFQVSSSGIKYGTDLSSASTTTTVASTSNVSDAETAAKNYAKSQADDAATKATNYLDFTDSGGLNIRYIKNGARVSQRVNITGDGIRVYDQNGTNRAFFGSYVQVGNVNDDGRIMINHPDYPGLYIVDSGFAHSYVVINSSGARFGRTDQTYFNINNTNGNAGIYTHIDSSTEGATGTLPRNQTRMLFNTNGIYLYHLLTGALKTFIGSYIQLGSTSDTSYAYMTTNGFTVYTKATGESSATSTVFLGVDKDDDYKPYTRIGRANQSHVVISSTELALKHNTTKYVSITSSGASFTGAITATSGYLGSWKITGGGLEAGGTTTSGTYYRCGIQPTGTSHVDTGASAFYAGCTSQPGNTVADPEITNFYVTHAGKLVCSDVQLGKADYGYIVFGMFTSTSNVKKSTWRPDTTNKVDLGSSSRPWDYIYSSHSLQTSDRKEKDGILPIDKAKEFILALQPVNYYLKSGNHLRQHMGFVAQDVSTVCKELQLDLSVVNAAYKDKEGHEYYGEEVDDNLLNWSLDYKEFIAPLVKVVQEQHKDIEQLKEEINELKSEIQELKQLIK